MGMTIEFEVSNAVVASVNSRTENQGRGKQGRLAHDVDFRVQLPAADALPSLVFDPSAAPDLSVGLWAGDGDPANLGIAYPLKVKAEFPDHRITFEVDAPVGEEDPRSFDAKLKKFSFKPLPDHMVEIGMQAQFYAETDANAGFVDRLPCYETVRIRVERPPQLDSENDDRVGEETSEA